MKLQISTRTVALGIMVTGLLVFTTSIGFLMLKPSGESGKFGTLPDQVAGTRLSNTTSGNQGLREIAQLHGKQFPLVSGFVGRYGVKNQAIIWVAKAADMAAAEQILLAMRSRIAEGNSPFNPIGELENGQRTIYMLEGLGQTHFYFQSGKQIVWTAVDATLYEKALQQILDYYP